ncbi:M20/M25/M40 family metallo-hydrolase [Pedobacter sandarakinus]|uniref:M20/M25/M40 family metallo-hydrolase n=1 Tax=Pedobacter sandarakinus TaxID=353156 RepID=UPI0022456D13|nr:M20/M25/M40 family metallo-hydrolase [Pedobacter sandarakinus]MCX2575457.1 M20/M25/M40 family metallo-hydrolase [Pedobacter sandarakinus]
MKKTYALLICSALTFGSQAQTTVNRHQEIDLMVKAVNQDSLKSYISKMVAFGTRNTLSDIKSKTKGIGAARTWVVSKFTQFAKQSDGRLSAFLDTTTFKPDGRRVDQPTLLGNAVAILKGTDPNDKRVYVVSGHLDSRVTDVMNRTSDAPGANDDGSGVAGVIEAARIMSKYKFGATIIFVAVSGEEQSLLGSGFMAGKAKKEGWNIDAMLNNDMIGSNNSSETQIIDNTRLRVFSEGLPSYELEKNAKNIRQFGLENDGRSRQLARYVKEVGERYVDQLEVKLIYRNDRFLRGGDHTPFVENGFTAVRITEMNENFDHQHQDLRTENGIRYGDLQEFMDFEYLRKNTAVNIAVLANLAKGPASPTEVKIDVKNLSNASFLYWKAPLNGKAKGYYVLMRETSSPVWEKKFYTTATELKIPYSKDNYLFAVQSVGAEDNESLPIVPGIGR